MSPELGIKKGGEMVEPTQKKTSLLAILSLVFGCLSLIPMYGGLFPIPAVILGIIALVRIPKDEDNLKGRKFAVRGILLGVLGLLLAIAIALPSILGAEKQLMQIGHDKK